MGMATASKVWTLAEVHSLPDDGNTYELVNGVLYVTPPPLEEHETIAARLARILDPYVAAHGLGLVYRPKSVFRIGKEIEVEPDLMVRQPHRARRNRDEDWETAPTPSLVVEIVSASTRRRDFELKPSVYLDEGGIPDYWVVNAGARTIHVYRRGHPATRAIEIRDELTWSPDGAMASLRIDLGDVFQDI
ncbi:MAG TPA: Uma2 family endonuclease [Gemmatimonadaceae bacterium]|nr:Uma2 family endonuclease [Gemmatimonadaceae bacterium]